MSETNWTTLTVDELLQYVSQPIRRVLSTAVLASGQTDPVPEIIDDIVASVRNAIASCRTNQLSLTAGTIPPELKRHAAALVIEAAQARIPGLSLSEDQRRAADNARAALRQIARCELTVTTPSAPESTPSTQSTARVEIASSRPNGLTRDSLSGLL